MIQKELPIILLGSDVLFPYTIASIFISQEETVNAIHKISSENSQEIICTFKNNDNNSKDPTMKDIYDIGVKMIVSQIITMTNGNIKILGNVVSKVKIASFKKVSNYFLCSYTDIETPKFFENENLLKKMYDTFSLFKNYIKHTKQIKEEEMRSITPNHENPLLFTYILTNKLDILPEKKQSLLESSDPINNLEQLDKIILDKMTIFQSDSELLNQVNLQISKSQKIFYLNEKMKAIQKELNKQSGEGGSLNEIEQMKKKAKSLKMSKQAKEKFEIEINKIKRNNYLSQEIGISKTYLENLLSLPWNVLSKAKTTLDEAKKILDADHYGLEKVKENIIEYLSVMQRIKEPSGQIICFIGPPGVGKTSFAESIAKSIKREFARFSLGGVYNESEIRGHRKTYIGAMPGRIIRMLQKCKTNNPVILLDEIDKVGFKTQGNHQSDITSSLLEILDKSQNKAFVDNYIEVEYDISKVIFIATANSFDIQPALLDRMNIINLSGYTDEEKIQITKKHLIEKQKKECGLKKNEISFTESAIQEMIFYYTREAGVRELERLITKICQKRLKKILSNEKSQAEVTEEEIKNYLGERKYLHTIKNEENKIGVANGLAYTSIGGDMLHIESVKVPGTGKITLTGKLGSVMEESAKIAYSCFKSEHLNLEYGKFNLHIHVPSGATPKDGPSAGITLYTSIYSLLLEKKVKNNVAMTGEITLQGKVMPIGGLKEKFLGAIRAEINTVIIPQENKKDLTEIPDNIKNKLKIHAVSHISEVITIAIE